jgi:hypothetical protein
LRSGTESSRRVTSTPFSMPASAPDGHTGGRRRSSAHDRDG